MLAVGEVAPDFALPDSEMEMVALSQFKGKHHVVLFFYPKDGTPSCTTQAVEFSDLEHEFRRQHTVVLGVSLDDCLSHAEFRDQQGLSLELLADEDGEVCTRYGVLQQVRKNGVTQRYVERVTYLIDKHGFVRRAMRVANPRGHAHEVLRLVKELKT